KSGIRVGEVADVRFEDRPGFPDGVLVTLAIERKYKIREGTVPRIARALIGDISIDLLPGTGTKPLAMSPDMVGARRFIIEGEVAPDPSKALEAATVAFQRVGGTLSSVDEAAKGIADVTKRAEKIDEFIVTWRDAGRKVNTLSDDLDRVIRAN